MGSGSQGCRQLWAGGWGVEQWVRDLHLYPINPSPSKAQTRLPPVPGRGSPNVGVAMRREALTCGDPSSYQTDDPATWRKGVSASRDSMLGPKITAPIIAPSVVSSVPAFQMHEWSSQSSQGEGEVNTPTLQMRKPRLRQGKDHAVSWWQSQHGDKEMTVSNYTNLDRFEKRPLGKKFPLLDLYKNT